MCRRSSPESNRSAASWVFSIARSTTRAACTSISKADRSTRCPHMITSSIINRSIVTMASLTTRARTQWGMRQIIAMLKLLVAIMAATMANLRCNTEAKQDILDSHNNRCKSKSRSRRRASAADFVWSCRLIAITTGHCYIGACTVLTSLARVPRLAS